MPDAPAPVDLDNAFNEGTEATQKLFDNYRHNLAMNALTKQYGAVAGDPTAWNQDQQNYLNSKLDPMKLSAAARENAAGDAAVAQYGAQAGNPDAYAKNVGTANDINEQQRMAAYRATKALQAQAGPDGSLPPGAVDQVLTPQNAQLFGLDPQHLAPLSAMLKAPGGAQHLDSIEQSLIGPTKITGAPIIAQGPNGQSMMLNRDQYGNPLATPLAPGVVPVSQQRANTAEQQAQTAGYNAVTRRAGESVQDYRARVSAANQTYGPQDGSQAPATPGQVGAPSAQAIDKLIASKGIDRAIAEAPPALAQAIADRAEQTKFPQQAAANSLAAAGPLDHLPPKGRQMAISQATQIANQGTNLHTVNTILDQVNSQISPYTTGSGSLLKDLPGSAQTDLKANLETLSAQGLTAWIQSLKNASGQTGIGRVLQSEANAAMKLYGNMEQDQSAKQLAFHAGLFRQSVNALYQHSQDAYKAQWGTDPQTALGHPAPAAAAAGAKPPPGLNLPPGFKYVGPAQ